MTGLRPFRAETILRTVSGTPFTPIEQAFSKLKHWMRKARTRTQDTLWRAVGTILDRFTPEEGANYFQNAGYASVKI